MQQLSTRQVYANPWMVVREDTIRRPDGSDGIFGVIDKPDYALIVPLDGDRLHLVEQFPGSDFVTGLVLDLDVETGVGTIINAGHPPPLLVRDGVVTELVIPPALPLGLTATTHYPLHPIELRSGDRLVLLTDGITEAHRRGGPEFGYPRLVEMIERHGELQPPELVRRITQEVCESVDGELGDDATLVCLDWRRPTTG